MGRKNAPMKKNQGADARQVPSSRSRSFALKKAGEIYTVCAVETAMVVFYHPAGPMGPCCVDAAMNLLAHPERADAISIQHRAEHEANRCELKRQYDDIIHRLESDNLCQEELKQLKKEAIELVNKPIDGLNRNETCLLGLRGKIKKQLDGLLIQARDSASSSDASVSTSSGVCGCAGTHCHDVGRGIDP